MSKFLDETGLAKLINDIKGKFMKQINPTMYGTLNMVDKGVYYPSIKLITNNDDMDISMRQYGGKHFSLNTQRFKVNKSTDTITISFYPETGSLTIDGNNPGNKIRISGVADPSDDYDIANKKYVDDNIRLVLKKSYIKNDAKEINFWQNKIILITILEKRVNITHNMCSVIVKTNSTDTKYYAPFTNGNWIGYIVVSFVNNSYQYTIDMYAPTAYGAPSDVSIEMNFLTTT